MLVVLLILYIYILHKDICINISWKFLKDKSQTEKDTPPLFFYPQCCKYRKYSLAFLAQSWNKLIHQDG